MKVYKLFRKRADGSLGPLFIHASLRVPVGEWMPAEFHPRKGFAPRKGWHCTFEPVAPHLKSGPDSGRVWCECEVDPLNVEVYQRPESQGGQWILADKLMVVRELEDGFPGLEGSTQSA